MSQFFTLQLLILSGMLFATGQQDAPVIPDQSDKTFVNPLVTLGPDPWVLQKDGWYYVTHTTGRDLRLYRTRAMSRLREAEMKTVWTPPATGMNARQIWAPEIHFFDGRWYFYYAADDGDNANHRMWVLENASADPFTGTWVDKGKLALPDDKWAIDGTAFENNGQLYFLWSGWEGDVNIQQNIYIAKMTDPTTVEGKRVLLSVPEQQWERHGEPKVNEGPQYLAHGGRHFIFFSASGCWTDHYAIGVLMADEEADLLDPSSWTKRSGPVMVTKPSANAFGPGHNSFFKSPDGSEDWILYHANPQAGQGCGGYRSVRMQPFSWTADGLPVIGDPVALGVELPVPSGE